MPDHGGRNARFLAELCVFVAASALPPQLTDRQTDRPRDRLLIGYKGQISVCQARNSGLCDAIDRSIDRHI